MKTKEFKSSQLKHGSYSEEKELLVIEFTTGVKYEYYGVSPELWRGLCDAESAGKYFNANIKFKCSYKKL
jgi:hypothetical protein